MNALLDANTYNAAAALANTDRQLLPVLLFCAISFVGAYMQYFGAIKNGFKDRTHAIPVGCNLWFFAHDTTYVAMFGYWFGDIGHWLMMAFWAMLLLFALLEVVVIYQVLRFSRQQVFPGLTCGQAIVAYLACQGAAYCLFWWFHAIIEDPLYFISFTTTVILTPVLTIPMMLHRGSRRGFSPFMLWGFVLLAVGFYLWMYWLDPFFTTPLFIWLGLFNAAIALSTLVIYYRLPEWKAAAH